jgi:hypothetical protein
MSKVRIGHEDELIAPVTNADNRPDMFHFDFNRK